MTQDLKDLIADFLKEAEDPVPAAELAKRFLKLVSPSGSDLLVRSIISKETRCEEVAPGRWQYRRAPEAAWLPGTVSVIEVAPGDERAPWLWRIATAAVTSQGPGETWTGTLHAPDAIDTLKEIAQSPMYTPSPARIRRWMESAEKILAIPEISIPVYDLRDAMYWLCDQQNRTHPEPKDFRSPQRWPALLGITQRLSDGLSGELEGALTVLEVCAETTSDRKLFQGFVDNREGRGKPVDFEPFNFTTVDLDELPEGPGVYRFINKENQVIYVGKAKNLRRRVGQYFAPLTDQSKRRQAFLDEIRDLKWTPLGSELSALVLESSEIRERRPRWNVQIETHDSENGDPGVKVFAIPSALHSGRFDSYFLTAHGAARLVPGEEAGIGLSKEDLTSALKSYFSSGGEEASPHLAILHPQEAILVRRWYQTQQDDLIKLNLDHFPTWQSAAHSFHSALASGDREGAWIRESPVL